MELDFRIDDGVHVTLVKGEDRTVKIRLLDKATGAPVSLVGADVGVQFKRDDGLFLERSSAAKAVASVNIVDDKLLIADHGLANGDVVQLTTTGTLPGGLALLTNYYVVGVGDGYLKLSATLGGSAIDITDAGSGVHSVSGVGLAVTSPANLGEVSVMLHDLVSAELQEGVFQDVELEYSISGVKRILQMKRAISVSAQVS